MMANVENKTTLTAEEQGQSRWAQIVHNPVMRMAVGVRESSINTEETEMVECISNHSDAASGSDSPGEIHTIGIVCSKCKSELRLQLCLPPTTQQMDFGFTRCAILQGILGFTRSLDCSKVFGLNQTGEACRGSLDVWATFQSQRGTASSHLIAALQESTKRESRIAEIVTQVIGRRSTNVAPDGSFYFYMRLMNKLGVSPYAIRDDRSTGILTCAMIRKGFAGLFSTFSIIQSIRTVKNFAMMFLAEAKNVGTYVTFVFHDLRLVTKLSFLHLLTFRQPKIDTVLECMKAVQEKREQCTTKRRSKFVAVLLTICSILMVIGRLLFGGYNFMQQWDFASTIKAGALSTGKALWAWNAKRYKNDTIDIENNYVQGVSGTTMLLAAAGAPLNFCGWTQDHMSVDSLLTLSIDLHYEVAAFVESISKTAATDTPEQKRIKLQWLVAIRKMFAAVNDAYGSNMVLIHGDNLLLAGQSILSQLNHETHVYVLFRTVNCIKNIITYIYGYKISSKNRPILEWLKKNKDMSNLVDQETGEEISVNDIIDQIENTPLGLGVPGAIIDAGFIKQFGTASASLFLFLASLQDKLQSCQCHCDHNEQ